MSQDRKTIGSLPVISLPLQRVMYFFGVGQPGQTVQLLFPHRADPFLAPWISVSSHPAVDFHWPLRFQEGAQWPLAVHPSSSSTFLPPARFRHEPRRWSVTPSKFSNLFHLQQVLRSSYTKCEAILVGHCVNAIQCLCRCTMSVFNYVIIAPLHSAHGLADTSSCGRQAWGTAARMVNIRQGYNQLETDFNNRQYCGLGKSWQMLFDKNLLATWQELAASNKCFGGDCRRVWEILQDFLGKIFNSVGHLKTKTIAKERQ